MGLSKRELEQLADEQYKGRQIANSIYCSECGYNLKTLPYQYQCPECGNEYYARLPMMKGIYFYDNIKLPLGDIFSALFFLIACLLVMPWAFNPVNFVVLVITLFLDVMTLLYGFRAYHKFIRYLRFRAIARHIASQESFEED